LTVPVAREYEPAVEWSAMDGPVLDEVRPGSEPFVTHRTGVRTVAEVEVLVLHQDVLVAEPSLADVALRHDTWE